VEGAVCTGCLKYRTEKLLRQNDSRQPHLPEPRLVVIHDEPDVMLIYRSLSKRYDKLTVIWEMRLTHLMMSHLDEV
jgi:hypothetical protein